MMKRKCITKTLVAVVSSAALLASFVSCGDEGGNVKTTDKGEIVTLNTVVQSETGEYDPAGAAAFVYFSHQSYSLSPLLSYTKDGQYAPATAESWEISDDLLTYTFHIRKDAKWSDGSDVTSEDFKNTMVRALNPENGSWYVDFLFPIKNAKDIFDGKADMSTLGVYCPDSKTLVLELAAPCAYLLDLCPNVPTFLPSNSKYAKDSDKLWDMDPAKNLGNGPWHMTERHPGEYILYEKNPYYYDAENVNVLAIKLRFMDDSQAKAAAYQSGELNIIDAPSSLAEAYVGKPDLSFVEVPQTNYVMFNPNKAPFDNPLVRKAFALAVNRKDIATVVGMSCVPSTTFVGRFYKSKIDGTPWGELQGNLLDENLEEAKRLLAEAGYPNGEGLPTITYTYPSMAYEGDVAQVLQQQWKELGVTVELQALENEVYVAQRRANDFQAIRMQWYADYNDPTSWLMMYVDGNSLNDIKWNNAKYNELMAESDLELDAKKRQDILLEAEKIAVSEDTVILPLFTNNSSYLMDTSLENYYYDVLAYPKYSGMTVKKDTK